MKYYIATGFARVREHNALRDKLTALGHEITYDWTLCKDEAGQGPTIASSEIRGVSDADLVVVLLPGKYGTHAELGAALASGIKVFLCDWTEEWNCVFYEHPLVTKHNDSELVPAIERWCHLKREEQMLLPNLPPTSADHDYEKPQ